jgi:hypothetical protein
MNKSGTIIGPKGTETIISMSELVKIGYDIQWNKGDIGSKAVVSKKGKTLPIHIKDATPTMPQEGCLELIEEIETIRKQKDEEGYTKGCPKGFQLDKERKTCL